MHSVRYDFVVESFAYSWERVRYCFLGTPRSIRFTNENCDKKVQAERTASGRCFHAIAACITGTRLFNHGCTKYGFAFPCAKRSSPKHDDFSLNLHSIINSHLFLYVRSAIFVSLSFLLKQFRSVVSIFRATGNYSNECLPFSFVEDTH